MAVITTDSLLTGRRDIVCTWARQGSVCHRNLCDGALLIACYWQGNPDGTRRALICPQDVLYSLTYGSMMGAASGTFCLVNIPKWQVVLDGEVWTLPER
jgi:hypothetical protein